MALAQEKALSVVNNDTVNSVMAQVREYQMGGRLRFPPNYSPENALMSAYLVLQQTRDREKNLVPQSCTKESVANALMDMVVQGLNPTKKQGYFIAYGKQLLFQRSYFGTITVAKRVTGAKDVFAEVVYKGDTFKFQITGGNTFILEHSRDLASIVKENMIAAYCTVVPREGDPYTQIMTMAQIHEAWKKSQNSPFDEKGNLKTFSVHYQFMEEMAKKTVTNRTCKAFINTSMDDSLDLVVERMNRADDAAEEAAFEEEVGQRANGEVLDADFTEKPDAEPAQEEQGEPEHEETVHEPVTEKAPDPAPEQGKTTTQPPQGTTQRRKPSYA